MTTRHQAWCTVSFHRKLLPIILFALNPRAYATGHSPVPSIQVCWSISYIVTYVRTLAKCSGVFSVASYMHGFVYTYNCSMEQSTSSLLGNDALPSEFSHTQVANFSICVCRYFISWQCCIYLSICFPLKCNVHIANIRFGVYGVE